MVTAVTPMQATACKGADSRAFSTSVGCKQRCTAGYVAVCMPLLGVAPCLT